jgi:hypothetical protein
MAANTRFVVKRSSVGGKTPNTADPANSSYIAAGELALNMTDKILYTSDGSELITIGATQTTIKATTVQLTDNITIGDISTSELVVNSTAVFAGNSTVNSSVNTVSISVKDPDHNSTITASSVGVANTTSNSSITPSVIFVGNSTSNAQFNIIQGSSTLTVTSYSYDPATLLTTFNLSTNHNFTNPLRGTQVTISGMTGSLANFYNNKTFDVNSIPTTNSFTVKLASGVAIATSSATASSASRSSLKLTGIQEIVSGGIAFNPITYSVTSVNSSGVLTVTTLSDTVGVNTPIYVPSAFAGLTAGGVYYIMSIDSANKKITITDTPGSSTPVSTSSGSGTIYCHPRATNLPLNTTLIFTQFRGDIVGQTGAAAIGIFDAPPTGLTLNYPYYITNLVLTDKTKFVLSTTSGGSTLTGLTPATYQMVGGVQWNYNFSATISGIASVTTSSDNPYVSGATVKVTGLGYDLPGLTLDGEYSILKSNSSVFYYTNNPYTSISPTGMYIDNNSYNGSFNSTDVWAATNSGITDTISTTAGISSNPVKLSQLSTYANSLMISSASGDAQYLIMNQIVFSAYTIGGTTQAPTYTPYNIGDNFYGIEIGKKYWIANTVLISSTSSTALNRIGTYTFSISDTLSGPNTAISAIDTTTKVLKANIIGSTLNFVKQGHGLTNSSIISGSINAYSNATVSYVCSEENSKLTGIPANVYFITNESINDRFNYNSTINYTLANSSITTNIPVTAYALAALPTYASPGTPSTSITVTIPKSSVPGLYAGYITIPDNSFVVNSTLNTTTVYSTPFDIIAVKSSGVVTVSSVTNVEKGQRILINTGAGTGTGLTTSSIYYANSVSGSDITLSTDGYTSLSTTATPSYNITAIKASGVVTVSSVTGLTAGARIKSGTTGAVGTNGIAASTYYIISVVSGSDITLTLDGSTPITTTAVTLVPAKYIPFTTAIQASSIKSYTTLLTGLNGKTLWFVDNGTVLSNTYVPTIATGTKVNITAATNPGSWITCDKVTDLSIGQQIKIDTIDYNTLYANRYFYIKDINTGAKQIQLSESYGGPIYYVGTSTGTASFTTQPNIVSYGGSQTNSTAGILKFIGNSTPQSNIVSGQYSETVIGLTYNGTTAVPTAKDKNYLTPIYKAPAGTTTVPFTKLTFNVTRSDTGGVLTYSGNSLPFYTNTMIVLTGTSAGGLVANSAYYVIGIDSLNSKITIANTRGGACTTSTSACTSVSMSGHGHITIGNSSTGSSTTNYTVPYLNGISTGDYILYNTDTTGTPFTAISASSTYFPKTVFQVVNITSNSVSVTYKDPSFSDGLSTGANRNRFYVNNQVKRLPVISSSGTVNQTLIYKFYPITQTGSKFWINYTNTLTSSKVTVTNSSSFYVPFTTTDTSLYKFNSGNFGTYANQVLLESSSYFYNITDYKFTTTPPKAATGFAATTTSGTSFNANSNFSSYVEIANTSAAIKITPSTFYIGNTVANLYSNSSFLSINAPTNLFQVTPSYMLFSKAINGVEDPTQSYFYAGIDTTTGSTGTFIGTTQKYTAFDGAGNQFVRGSSITVTNDLQSTYIDDYSVTVSDLETGACTSITSSAAVFGGSVDINGPINLQGTSGTAGQTLLTDGAKSYWGDFPAPDTTIPYNFTSDVSISGALNVLTNATYKNSTITRIDDNNNYTEETANYINIFASTGETTKLNTQYIQINTNDLYSNSSTINSTSISVGNSTVNTVVNSTSFTGTIYANSSTGAVGQVLRSDGSGKAYWDDGSQATNARQVYTADGSTTTFTVTAGYTPNNLDVYLNGVKLQNGTEVSATNGTTFTINVAPASGSIIEVVGGIVAGITTAVPYVATTDTSITINPSVYNGYFYTALASTLTINASTTGSPVNGTRMIFRFKDSGTVRTLTWTTSGAGSFRVIGTTLPTTTTSDKTTYVACIYNADEQYWDVVAVAIQA